MMVMVVVMVVTVPARERFGIIGRTDRRFPVLRLVELEVQGLQPVDLGPMTVSVSDRREAARYFVHHLIDVIHCCLHVTSPPPGGVNRSLRTR